HFAAERPPQKHGEDRVLGRVGELAEHEIPAPEPRREARNRGQREDHARPHEDGQPAREQAHRAMIGSFRERTASGEGTPVRVRDGPAAVRGEAPPPRRHWPPGREGGGGGRPESEDLPPAATTEPLAEGGFVFRRLIIALAAIAAALALAPTTLAALVHVRVEGKTVTLFGAANPTLSAATPMEALEGASLAGGVYHPLPPTPFAP